MKYKVYLMLVFMLISVVGCGHARIQKVSDDFLVDTPQVRVFSVGAGNYVVWAITNTVADEAINTDLNCYVRLCSKGIGGVVYTVLVYSEVDK